MLIRLQSSWSYLPNEKGLEIFSLMKRKKFIIHGNTETLLNLFQELENGIEIDERKYNSIAEKNNITVKYLSNLINNIEKNGVLIRRKEALSTEYDSLYDRQIRFYDLYESNTLSGEQYNNSLQNSKVVIIGLGSYGTWLSLMCARVGIKKIVVVDFDTVESTNLNRQILYNKNDLNKTKVDATKNALKNVDEQVEILSHNVNIKSREDLIPLIEGADLVFNTFGYYPNTTFELIWKTCFEENIPVLNLGGSWIGPLTVPGKSPCVNCLYLEKDLHETIQNSQVRYLKNNHLPNPAFAPRMALTSSIAMWEATRFLSKSENSMLEKGLLLFDIFNYDSSPFREIKMKKECENCKNLSESYL